MSDTVLQRFLAFLDASPTPWHAVGAAAARLEQAGFTRLDEAAAPGELAPGAQRYVARSGTLIAFRVGARSPVEAGFRITSAHTDSPNLRLKPQPVQKSNGYVRLGVEVYGGVLLATWTDRDLGLAGQVVLRDGKGQRTALVDIRRPICRIPNLAIHLNRGVNDDGLKVNAQTQLPALFALDGHDLGADPVRGLLGRELGCDPGDVLTWDLCLFDLTAPAQGGANGEFVFSARLDNLGSSHAALEGMLAAAAGPLADSTSVIALFDHEEIGSTTSRGATSRLLEGVLERVLRGTTGEADLFRAVASSLHLSADMAHALHPSYADKHEPHHMPLPNRGPVIKQHASQRYGTEAETSALVVRLCEAHEIPYQWFVNRTDLACGSTVGPLVAAQLGIPTVDVGNPMLSMHSIREMCGSADQEHMVALMAAFLAGEG